MSASSGPLWMEYPGPITVGSGQQLQTRIKYFDYGVVSVELELEFEADWDELVRLSSRWIPSPDLEKFDLGPASYVPPTRRPRITPALFERS